MAANRFGVILLLVFGVFLMGCNLTEANAKFCPYYCRRDTAYMTCPSSGDKHLAPACNCCLARKGCTIYLGDGTAVCTGT